LSADGFVDQFGASRGGNFVLDLGDGNSITFENGINESALADSLIFF